MKRSSSTVVAALFLALLLVATNEAARHRKHRQTYQDIDSDDETSDVQISVFPSEKEVRDGRDVSFECRARTSDNSVYPTVRWARVGGPLPASAHDSGGRLTINPVSLSDAGTYICVSDYNGQTVEARATLSVVSYGPQEVSNGLRQSGQCMADEKACGNNECVKNDYVCDGEPDCRDRSDEANCPAISRTCEPNEFKCNNNKCVQKMWLCDGDDDCGDNSDELNCNAKPSSSDCKPTEFQCHDRRQCVPSSFHCDGTNDCHDGSDEVGCVQPTVVDPPQTNLQVPRGSTFSLTCKAVAVPEPYINWRLNWGPVCEPPRCLQTSEGGYGTLTIHDAQPVDQGAYTCEAINVKGRVLATPDCIVRVVEEPFTHPPPPPVAPPQRATCDTRGATTPYANNYGTCECKSQVTGPNCDQCKPGAFHLSEKSPDGCLKCFCFGVSSDCRSSGYYRTKDAACDRLMFAGDAEGVTISDIEERAIDRNTPFSFFKTGYLTFDGTTDGVTKYWRLPQRFLGNKVTAYGGKMEFEVEFSGSGAHSTEPIVVLKGNQNILVHRVKNQEHVLRSDSPVRITVETYETNYEQLNGASATREDLLMVLADLDAYLIRATHVAYQTSTSLGDVSWEIAVDRYTPDGLAIEVEQCVCPPGYVGTSCEDCAPGYERSGQGPYLGTCIPIQPRHQQCGPGAVAPTVPAHAQCQCKASVIGPNCDRCAPSSFGLAPTNPQGCIPCFCSGVSQQCSASNYKRKSVSIDYTRGDRDQLELTTSDSRQPYSPQSRAQLTGGAIEFRSFEEARGQALYWKLPEKFLGDKVTSYGGVLKYTFKFSGNGNTEQSADVILRGNDIALQYKHREPFYADRENNVEIKIMETSWQRVDGQQATREHLLMTLADLDTILIKSTYNDDCTDSQLISVSLEYAEPYGHGLTAAEVEQCICPPGYVGTSCEDCAPGYSRTGGGLYLGLCEKCECNGHASQCDKEYGYCLDCQHNTEGDQCERCKPGFVGDARRGTPNDCQPEATRAPCQCNNHSPRGCDSFGRCLLCEHNTEGTHCERCKKGYYGDATKGSPYDCTPCPCPGASDCYLDSEGQVACRICPAGLQGRLCNECAPGYTRSNKPAGRVCEPIGTVTNEDITFVQKPHEGGRPPQPVIDPPHLVVNEGEPAAFRCWVPGIPDCQITWHREQLGGPLPYGVYQTGNALKIPQSQLHHAGRYICSAANQYGIGQSPPAVLEVKKPVIPPKVDPIRQTVDRGQPARFKCWVPGNSNVQLKWSRPGGGPLPSGVQEQQGILHISRAQDEEAGQYVCTATDPSTNTPLQSEPVQLNIRDPAPIRAPAAPQIDPPNQTVNVNDPAQFRCWVPGQPRAQLKWSRKDGRPLPNGILERDGFLRIDRSQLNDAGEYECTASEPDGSTQVSPPARLNVNQPQAIQPQVDPPVQTVNEGDPSRIRCWVPGHPNIQLQFVKRGRRPVPHHARVSQGNLEIPRTLKADEDEYICIATDPNTNRPVESNPARIIVKSPIRPIIDPVEQTIPEGSPFRIRCYVPGHPNVQLSFRRVSGQLNDDADENNGHLAIQRAELTDAGDYICTARDPDTGAPIDSNPATVHVTNTAAPPQVEAQQPQHPVITPQTQTVPEGDPARIQCSVPGNPAAVQHLSFERADGRQLPFGSSDDRGIFTIPSTQVQDAGDYVCIYAPENSHPLKTNPSTLNVTPEGTPPRPVATPPLLSVAPGSPARFNCVAHSDTPARIKWGFREENGALPENVNQDGDDLVVSAAGNDNVGEYVCSATNDFGTGVADPVRLEVTEDQEPPTAVVEPRTWNGKPGERHQFRCITTGSPTPKITWTGPDGSPLPHDVTPLEPNILDFSNGRSELNGDYTCTATNPIGEASDHGVVNIGPSLTVKTNPAGPKLIVTVGEPLQVKCEAFGAPGDPEPEVEWLHDPGPERGDLPDDFKPVTISEQFIRHPNVGLGNAGVYTCKGSSAHATATKNIYIEVVEPSRIATVSILGGSSQWFDQGEKGELICTATGSSLVDRLEWEKIDDQLPTDVEEHNEPGLLHFPSFKKTYAGEYRCNGYRNSEIIAAANVHVHSSSDADDEPKVEIEPPRVRVVSQGDNIVLKCSVQGAENGEHFKWALLRGGSLVRQLGTEPTLEISRADPSNDFGVYRCNVEDNNGLVIGSAYTAVSVGQQDKTHAQIVKFDDKSDASFTCPIYSVPGSNVEWIYENGDLPSKAVPNGNKIEIKEFDDASAGTYVCRVSFDGNVVEGFVTAQMFVPDTIIQVLLEVSSESPQIGDRAWFDCKVTGDPSALISWNKEGNDDLPPNAQVYPILRHDVVCNTTVTGGRLLFTDLKEDNAGVYRCVAKTKAGPLQTRTVLNVGSGKLDEKTFTVVSESLPVIYTVGQPAYLSCIGKTTTKPNQSVVWTKEEGQLPFGSRVEQGVLMLPSVHREDEGSYTCEIVKEEDPVFSTVDLQVDDFVPIVNGDPIELPPLTDEELINFDIEITLNSFNPKGIIFETRRINSGDLLAQPFDTIHHEARITSHGTILYEFDLGYGTQVVESRNPINLNEWNVIKIKNDKNGATIQLNDEVATVRQHTSPLPSLSLGVNRPVFIGGRFEPTNEADDFNGIISQVILSGHNVGLGDARIPETAINYDTCASTRLCLNDAVCRTTNNHKGFRCDCSSKFHGEYCQWRSNSCHEESCNTGICLDNAESWQCVCPLGTSGLRCEEQVDIPQPLGFASDTSFIAVRKPIKFESLKMKLRPKPDSDEHILMYFASEYGASTKQFTSLSLISNQVVLTTNKPNEEIQRIKSEPLEAGELIDVTVKQDDNELVMTVNGNLVSSIATDPLKPGTEIFIGGLSPGLNSPDHVVEKSFHGCVYEVFINSENVDLRNLSSSGDISSCEESEFPVEDVEEETTTTTTTTEKPEVVIEEPITEEHTTTTTEEPATTTTTEEPTTTTEEPYNMYEILKDDDPEIIFPIETTTTTTTTTESPMTEEESVTEATSMLPTDTVKEDVSDEERDIDDVNTVYPETDLDDYSEGTLSPYEKEDVPIVEANNICVNATCGMNGQCVPRNETHYSCECNLYYDGPTCSLFKPIEHAARFDGNAFIELSTDEFPHLTSEREEIVAFKFKSEQSNGLLLWQGQRPTVQQMEDYISVGIVNGHLHFSYELGGGAAHLVSEERIDDGKQHNVRFERKGRDGLMKIDNQREISGRSTGILAMLNVDGNIFVGGVPDLRRATGGLFSNNFIGCIADVELNGVKLDLMATAIDGKNVKPCDEWMHRKRWLYRRKFRL